MQGEGIQGHLYPKDGPLTKFKVDVPEGRKGRWIIEKFTVPDAGDLETLRAWRDGRPCAAGTFTRLVRDGVKGPPRVLPAVVMSDTPSEVADHFHFIRRAEGHVLIAGLGLGMVIKALLAKVSIERIDVVEIDKDLIDLVGPHYFDPRLRVYHDDIKTWKSPRGSQWDFVWLDIWDSIDAGNLDLMRKLRKRFMRQCGSIQCWCEGQCRELHVEQQEHSALMANLRYGSLAGSLKGIEH